MTSVPAPNDSSLKTYDVIVAGGGPAGSTAAALLAKAGHSVLVLERATFPRFHIGESLLPAELPLFEKLGFDVTGIRALHKQGADFLDERQGKRGRFFFTEALPGTGTHAWQIERSIFDNALLRNAERLGAQVRENCPVTAVDMHADGVTVRTATGEERARFFIDATGRERLLSKQHSAYERVDGLGLAAVSCHFDGLSMDAMVELEETGNITVLMLDDGWGWVIPLVGGRLSVGFVSATKGIVSKDWFERNHAASPFLQRITFSAERSELRLEGDYSYKNPRPYGARFACIGDSGGFLDPVFSSGVTIAMASADKLVDLLSPALEESREGAEALLEPLNEYVEHAYSVFDAVLRSFYHTNLVDNLFFYDDPDLNLRAGLVSILAGDVWRDDNDFQKMLLRRNAKRFARSGA